MQPDNFYFGGGTADTTLLPVVAVLMILTIGLVLALPKKYVVVPFLLCVLLIPPGQTLVVAGVHLFVLRIVLLFAWLRVVATKFSSGKSVFGGRLETFDKIFAFWALYHAFATFVVFHFQSGAIVNQVAFLLDALGSYFFLRYLIRDSNDILRVIKVFAAVAGVVGLFMLNEKLRGQNLFGYLGGPFAATVRDGAIRAQGPFAHPILAGTFGATALPLFLYLWKAGKAKTLAMIGVVGSTVMTLTAASSTPLTAYVGGLIAVFLWPMRKRMRSLRWGIVMVLLALQVAMKAPVWFLIARVDLTGASSGYHRAMLVDGFVRHFGDWWLVGTTSNATWGFDMWDLSNQFVAEGVSGGLATFICFVAFISICFGKIGTARKAVRGDRTQEWFLWLLGAALFSHIVAFWGISYFDHTQVVWFALLAMILAASRNVLTANTVRKRETAMAQMGSQPGYLPPASHIQSEAPPAAVGYSSRE